LHPFGTREEVANLVHFLCLEGDYITGQVLSINGGLYMWKVCGMVSVSAMRLDLHIQIQVSAGTKSGAAPIPVSSRG
jgi:hypothetical protein